MKTLLLLFISILLLSTGSIAQTDSTLVTIPNYVKSGFGATLTAGFGLGVENKEIFETEDGDESTLSAGGGFFIGTGLYYITEKNIKFGSTFYYQAGVEVSITFVVFIRFECVGDIILVPILGIVRFN